MTDITCSTDCIRCPFYYRCDSMIKIDESARDYWLEQEEQAETAAELDKEYKAMLADVDMVDVGDESVETAEWVEWYAREVGDDELHPNRDFGIHDGRFVAVPRN